MIRFDNQEMFKARLSCSLSSVNGRFFGQIAPYQYHEMTCWPLKADIPKRAVSDTDYTCVFKAAMSAANELSIIRPILLQRFVQKTHSQKAVKEEQFPTAPEHELNSCKVEMTSSIVTAGRA